jgi:hypothetical protein
MRKEQLGLRSWLLLRVIKAASHCQIRLSVSLMQEITGSLCKSTSGANKGTPAGGWHENWVAGVATVMRSGVFVWLCTLFLAG